MRHIKRFALAALGLLAICTLTYLALSELAAVSIRGHQLSTTAELAQWAIDYGSIRTTDEAHRAIGMLEYIQNYYVVAERYRSDPETERQLEAQRDASMRAISSAIDHFIDTETGETADSLRDAKSNALAGSRWEGD